MSKGVVLSVAASVLFAVMYYFTSLLAPLSGLEIFGWRMLLTVPCMTVFMVVCGEWRQVWQLLRLLAGKPRLIGGIVLSSVLLGCNCGCLCGRRSMAAAWMCPWATSCCR